MNTLLPAKMLGFLKVGINSNKPSNLFIFCLLSTNGGEDAAVAGIPLFACFISELLIFVGAFQKIKIDSFYTLPTALMLIVTVLSLAYAVRYIGYVFWTNKA